ncbi:hypothetical protein [Microvirga terricola]|uniref:Uncharacterized protein n=1 Tax=Microvirga terricola TaxID=2719797 RepID=A0ABX0V903_9HYPH|nr:hypothetical protein [Microvirga terricola]NIX76038.1 hypothetical protein [Microvirga terricola]
MKKAPTLVLLSLLFGFLVPAASAKDLSPPQRFNIFYGNGLFGFVTVRLEDGQRLILERHVRNPGREVIEPSPEAWRRFRGRLDRLAVWKWKKSYPNPWVKDGTQWRIAIRYKDRTLDVSGSNAYPLPGGTSNKSPRTSPHFQAFLDSLRDLMGQELR